ncbi:MAG: hypothetical protein ABIH08_03740 [Candidatus Omnitrophota bacterium]
MMKKVILVLVLGVFLPINGFCSSASEYLIERGRALLEKDCPREAKEEFRKVLLADSCNQEARAYLAQTRQKEVKNSLDSFTLLSKTKTKLKLSPKPAMAVSLKDLEKSKQDFFSEEPAKVLKVRETKAVQPKIEPEKKTVEAFSSKEFARAPQVKEIKVIQPKTKISSETITKKRSGGERTPIYPEYIEEDLEADSKIKISGTAHASFGVDSDDGLVWKRSNMDMNEKNWRMLSGAAHNRKDNTSNIDIFDRFRIKIEKPVENGWGFGSDFDISPWSFIGKSSVINVTSENGDIANIVLKYWSNTGRTVNETFYSEKLGNFFSTPEMKVKDNKVIASGQRGIVWGNGSFDTFNIPEAEIYQQFWPAREFWFGYNKDDLTLKILPVAKDNLAYNSDDPLNLSNRHIYWEESQWLVNWRPGHFNTGGAAQDFLKGWWDDSSAFFTRDSKGERLTSLRGLSFKLDSEKTLFDFTTASPKELWQNYESFDTFAAVSRFKYFYLDNLTLGFLQGSKLGYNDRALDVYNNFFGFDFNLGLDDNTQIFTEVSASRGEQDKASADYKTKKRGNAFHLSLVNSSKQAFGENYFALEPTEKEQENPFYKLKLSFTHMDQGFETALASFRETRDDMFWSRHLTFKQPFENHLPSITDPAISWNDVKDFRIGDGIDYGRDVISFRYETKNLPMDKLDALFDIRNVHNTDGEYIENVSRLELTHKTTPKLTTKFLGIYQDLPKTDQGIDPFIIDPNSGDFYKNASVDADKDPTLKTMSLGFQYDFFKWLDTNFIWERTNDCTLAYGDFPRDLFGSTWMTTFNEYNHTVRQETSGLSSTNAFYVPPYPDFDIFKLGINLRPQDNLRLRLDYTRNEYGWAQLVDDNINHIGFDVRYLFSEKLGFYFRYVYSRANDIAELQDNSRTIKSSHHTLFSEIQLKIKEDSEFAIQYGIVPSVDVALSSYTPFGTASPTLDTQHIVKLYYSKKF